MYGISVRQIYKTLYPYTDKILSLTAAASFLGLSKGWGIPVTVYYDSGLIRNSEYFAGYKVNSLGLIPYIERYGVKCTNEERTICDLLKADSCVQTINQSLFTYYYKHDGNINILLEHAKNAGIDDKIEKQFEFALKHYEE